MPSALSQAILKAQQEQIWAINFAHERDAHDANILSKIWKLSQGCDSAMISVSCLGVDDWDDEMGREAISVNLARWGYRYAWVQGAMLNSSNGLQEYQPCVFWYVFDPSNGGALGARLLEIARHYHQPYITFQAHDGDYELISCVDGQVLRTYERQQFGIMNGHFYKELQSRPFILSQLISDVSQIHYKCRALLLPHAQQEQVWQVNKLYEMDAHEESLLSKVWTRSHRHDTGMIFVSHLSANEAKAKLIQEKLGEDIMNLGYRYAWVKGTRVGQSISAMPHGEDEWFWYVYDTRDSGYLKADLLRITQLLNQPHFTFQAQEGDYELINSHGSTLKTWSRKQFGILNGHFYKHVDGRPFNVSQLCSGMSYRSPIMLEGYFEKRDTTEGREQLHAHASNNRYLL